jgi:hypothetical protein
LRRRTSEFPLTNIYLPLQILTAQAQKPVFIKEAIEKIGTTGDQEAHQKGLTY